MKRLFILTISLLLPYFSFSQEKGVTPVNSISSTDGMTRAVVVGVSKYQDSNIPSLRFAHVDAEEFAKFLQSKAGGSLTTDQIVLITDEQATAANIYSQLSWLLEETQEGDRVIFYFSGHGDVETKTSRNKGFLLAHDTPSNNYFVGGVRVNDINDILADLVDIKKAKILLITDACRSGNLAGGQDGTTATASALSERYNNQVKIMSCQPNELSLEGEQWGGGRGIFSYHLIDGLTGMADEDGNEEVDLSELDDYLDDRIPKETEKRQYPLLVGSPRTSLAKIDADELAALIENKSSQEASIAAIGTKGIEEAIFANADTSIQRIYKEFISALDKNYFLPQDLNGEMQKGKSASELFDILSNENSIASLHPVMRRNFAVALQDQSQKSINAYLKADPQEMKERWENFGENYKSNPAYLSKAASLLGESHFLHDRLIAKKYYYEGLILRLEGERNDIDSLYYLALEKEKSALRHDGDAAYIFNEIGLIKKQLFKSGQKKNIEKEKLESLYRDQVEMFEKASAIAPKWVMPYLNLCWTHYLNDEIEKVEFTCQKAAVADSTQIGFKWIQGNLLQDKNEHEKAIHYYLEVIKINPNFNAEVYNNLGLAYQKTDRHDLAEKMYLKSISINPENSTPYENLGFLFYINGEYEKCIEANKKWIVISPDDNLSYYNIACLYSLLNKPNDAIEWLEKAIQKGFNNFEKLKSDEDLKNAKNSEAFNDFAEKYLKDN